jgi:hypothetical protein
MPMSWTCSARYRQSYGALGHRWVALRLCRLLDLDALLPASSSGALKTQCPAHSKDSEKFELGIK